MLLKYVSLIFGSFFIFIYILSKLRALLANNLNDKIKAYIKQFTSNYHVAFLLGIILTILLSSSTALTIITIAFLSANLISEKSSFSLLLGANIGTTITAFIFSFNIGSFSFIFIILGLILLLLKKQNTSLFFTYLGIIFYCLTVIEISVTAITENIQVLFFDSLLITTLEGIVISIIFNSSSTTIITAGLMYKNNILSLSQGLSLMLGANIGTTITSYFYTLNQPTKTKKIIIYNIIFNTIGALFFLCFIDYFIIILYKLNLTSFDSHIIALSHFIFNLLTTVIIYIIFIPVKKIFNE